MPEAETILIVDDNPTVRKVVCAHVESGGYRVLEAASPESALALSRAYAIDAVITDLIMPGGGGAKLVEDLRRGRPALPALFMSGLAGAQVQGTFIAKPFSTIELLAALRLLLDETHLPVAIGA
jgi:CheY-like chemotaxis protein